MMAKRPAGPYMLVTSTGTRLQIRRFDSESDAVGEAAKAIGRNWIVKHSVEADGTHKLECGGVHVPNDVLMWCLLSCSSVRASDTGREPLQ